MSPWLTRKVGSLCTRCGVQLDVDAESVLCPTHAADNAARQRRHRQRRQQRRRWGVPRRTSPGQTTIVDWLSLSR